MQCRDAKLQSDGGNWGWRCRWDGSCQLGEQHLEDVAVLFRPMHASPCSKMDSNTFHFNYLRLSHLLCSSLLPHLLCSRHLYLKSSHRVSLPKSWSSKSSSTSPGSSSHQRFWWFQALHSSPPWIQVLVTSHHQILMYTFSNVLSIIESLDLCSSQVFRDKGFYYCVWLDLLPCVGYSCVCANINMLLDFSVHYHHEASNRTHDEVQVRPIWYRKEGAFSCVFVVLFLVYLFGILVFLFFRQLQFVRPFSFVFAEVW